MAHDFDLNYQFIFFAPRYTSQLSVYPAVWALEAMKAVPDIYYIFVDYSAFSKVKVSVENLQGITPYIYCVGKVVGELSVNNCVCPFIRTWSRMSYYRICS